MNKVYTIEDFEPMIKNGGYIPNLKLTDEVTFLDRISSFGHSLYPVWVGKSFDIAGGKHFWTQLFLNVSNGSGYGVTYPHITFEFALCKHEKVLRPTDRPNYRYGWDPGVCSKCGLNMDVDSGD